MDVKEINECGPLDHARADQTAEEKSQYRIDDGQGVRGLYIYAIAIWFCDIRLRYNINRWMQGLIGQSTGDRDIASVRDKRYATKRLCDGATMRLRYRIEGSEDCEMR